MLHSLHTAYLDDVELASSSSSDCKAEKGGLLHCDCIKTVLYSLYNNFSCLLVALHLELDEGSGVALDWLRHLALHAVQLHCSHHSGKTNF